MNALDFLRKIILEDYSCQIFKNVAVYNHSIIIRNDLDVQWINRNRYKILELTDTLHGVVINLAYYIDHKRDNYIEFEFNGNFEEVEKIIECISSEFGYCYKLLNQECYIRHFLKIKPGIYNGNSLPEIINFVGLNIRHKRHNHRYSDFGTDAYTVSIIGDLNYFSPYEKTPIEIDFFHGERTKLFHVYPDRLLDGIDFGNYSDDSIVELLLAKAFAHFFNQKKYIVCNFDEYSHYSQRTDIVLPQNLDGRIFWLSAKFLTLYKKKAE